MDQPSSLSRQVSLNPHRSKEGMKVLEKFCKRKYRHSVLLNSRYPSFENFEAASTPEPLPSQATSSFSFPVDTQKSPSPEQPLLDKNTEREPTSLNREPSAFSKQVKFADIPTVDFCGPKFKDEIKFNSETETRKKYFIRLLKVLYKRLGLKYVILLIILVAYALLGGLLFYYLEAPAEREYVTKLTHDSVERHHNLTQQILYLFSEDACYTATTKYREELYENDTTTKSIIMCNSQVRDLLQKYDKSAGIDPGQKRTWSWDDYWNAVFYCATIFTTIGYGNMSCRTGEGRLATICYALCGVPYMLVVLNSVGKIIYRSAQAVWDKWRRMVRRKTKVLRRRYIMTSFATIEDAGKNDAAKGGKEGLEEDDNFEDGSMSDEDIFETFPLYLALIIIFAYIGICSLIFCIWEKWDYFTAFYFFFISLTTVGLGDEMPDHPHFACFFFIFFLIGLALVSMCVSIMQMRVENQYMAALQIIEEEQMSTMSISPPIPSNAIHPAPYPDSGEGDRRSGTNWPSKLPRTPTSGMVSPNLLARTAYAIRWREKAHPSPGGPSTEQLTPSSFSNDFDSSERQDFQKNKAYSDLIPSTSTTSGQHPHTPLPPMPPPVLGVFIARSKSTFRRPRNTIRKKNEAVPESPEGGSSKRNTIAGLHMFSASPSTSPTRPSYIYAEHISPQNKELLESTPSGTPTTPASASHTYAAPLSVITEASDEEVRDQTQKDPLWKDKAQLLKAIDEDAPEDDRNKAP